MAGYIKRIALIKTVKKGFSSDGGDLSGLVKCEAYAGFLKAELSLINFAPVGEGRYRFGLSDGKQVVLFDSEVFETELDFDLSGGFAALICFCKGKVFPIASAVCGDNVKELAEIERVMTEEEAAAGQPRDGAAYEDEAIAEVNYYELEAVKGGRALCEDKEEEKDGRSGGKDEKSARPVADAPLFPGTRLNGSPDNSNSVYGRERAEGGSAEKERAEGGSRGRDDAEIPKEVGAGEDRRDCRKGDFDRGFFGRMQSDVRKIFAEYPAEERLQRVVEGSRWAKISYGGGRYYAFGVLYSGGNAQYLCYGVPSDDGTRCPRSLEGRASYIPVEGGGYWVMYQDAKTGVSIKIENG